MDFETLHRVLTDNDNFAVFGHINPDGDSMGAMLAMALILDGMGGKKVSLYSRDGVPDYFRFLPGADRITDRIGSDGKPPVVVVLVDCGGPKRAGDEFVPFIEAAGFTAVIDHHGTNDGFGNLSLVDPGAASTCEIIARYVKQMNIPISADLATCLYTGIMYDTGRFMHSNTTPAVFQICAELVSQGADPSSIANRVYNQRGIAHLRLLGYALRNMQFAEDGAISWSIVNRKIYDEIGADDEDAEGIVEQIGAYKGCEVHISFSQARDGRSRVSMRSTGRINVGEICSKFGGGGHDFASGLRSKDPLDVVVERVIEETRAHLRRLRGKEI